MSRPEIGLHKRAKKWDEKVNLFQYQEEVLN